MEIVVVMGHPASGKSTFALEHFPQHHRANRDLEGGTLDDLVPIAREALTLGRSVVLDNTYATRTSRAAVLDLARSASVPVRCVWIDTTIEDAQVNAVTRMIRRYGKLLSPDEIKSLKRKDPNTFGPSVLFQYRKAFEAPTTAEGFAAIERVRFARTATPTDYVGKALLLDYDGTLRRTKSGDKYPRTPDDVDVLPGRTEVLRRYHADGYKLLGVSNQGDVARGKLTIEAAQACFARTNELLGVDIEVSFCPHDPAPIGCWCRKPMPGMGVAYLEKHRLDRAHTVMVGDMTTDRTFAQRVGIRYLDQAEFFG